MPKFEEFIKDFDEEDTPEYDYPFEERDLNPRDTPRKAKLLAQARYAYNKTNDKDLAGKLFDEYLGGNYAKARKLIELGEEPFGTHTYTYEKDGKFYGSGFEDEDIELSSEDMARMYDKYTKAKEEEKNEPKQPMKPLSKDFKKEIEQMRASFKKKFPSAFGK